MTNYECENRISDDEIISSLEVIATTRNCNECKIRNCNWGDCNCSQITANAALDLINRLQAEIGELKHEREVLIEDIHHSANKINEQLEEIEKLKIENKSLRSAANCYKLHYSEARTEAIKEFADRLKQKSEYYENGQGWEGRICYNDDIDKLLKEMVGDTE